MIVAYFNAFKVFLGMSVLCLFPLSQKLQADDKKSEQPSQEFLEFLADMSEVDGELSDPLDMLEVEDSELSEKTIVEEKVISKAKNKTVQQDKIIEPTAFEQEKQ